MPDPNPIIAPAGYVPRMAISFAASDGQAAAVGAGAPLPVSVGLAAATAAPLTGTAAGTSVAGPFTPELGRPIWLTLSGNWTGKVAMLRSTDQGATKLPLSVGGQPWASFTENMNEAVIEESDAAASYYLSVAITSGTLTYRVAQ